MSGQVIAPGQLAKTLLAQREVNDPFVGQASAQAMQDKSLLWPGPHWREMVLDDVTEAQGRRFEEYRFTSVDGVHVNLPVGFMFAEGSGGGSAVRVYSGHHLVPERGPILPVQPGLHPWRSESDVLFAYFQALNGNKLEALLDLFEHDGYFRHSNGETFKGREPLRQDFTKMMGSAGIRIDYCLMTDDGTVCAAEVYMPSGRPAVATYERGQAGRLKAVRIYL